MRRFWDDVIRPCFEAANVRRIVEIGSDHGENTVKLVHYAEEKDGLVFSIDPAPQFDYGETFLGKEKYYRFFKTTSINAIPKIRDYDAILIDGDHNWYTVYTELQLVLKNAERFPLVFFHDVSWPYDRRDLYYAPETIPAAWQNAYKISGIDPETDELSEKGFNHKLCNSVSYTNYHCGVLTAVEDFVRENQPRFEFMMIPIMSGLGILIDTTQKYPDELYDQIRLLTPTAPLERLMRFSDKWFAKTHSRMEQQMEALQQLKEDREKKTASIEQLKKECAEKNAAIEQLKKECGERNAAIEQLKKTGGEKDAALEQLKSEYGEKSAAIEHLKKECGEKDAALEQLRSEYREKSAVIEQLKKERGEKIAAIERLERDYEKISLSIKQLRTDCGQKAETITRLEKDCAEHKAQLHLERLRAEKAEESYKRINERFAEERKKIEQLQSERDAALNERNAAQSERDAALNERNAAQSERDAVLNERDAALNERDAALNERNAAQSERDAALNERDAALSERDAALNKRDAAQSERSAALSERDTAQKKCQQLNGDLEKANKERDEFRGKLQTCEKQLTAQRKKTEENEKLVDKYANSIRYQIGEAFVNATRSLKAFLLLPFILIRLFRQAKKLEEQRKNGTEPTGTPPAPPSKPPVAHAAEQPQKSAPAKPACAEPSKKSPAIQSKYSEEELRKLHRERVTYYSGEAKPLVSIIVINKDGLNHLKTLFSSMEKARFYDRYELIVVDNASTDGSIEFLKAQKMGKKLQLIENKKNESFSHANNQAAAAAQGSYLLFMNNDIEVTDGWLDELLRVAEERGNAGAVGAKLIYPKGIGGINDGKDCLIQHSGILFRRDEFGGAPFIRPFNRGNGEQAWPDDGQVRQFAAVTAAVMLVPRKAFDSVGGFDEQYVYGYEDVDICLKLHKAGYKNYYAPRAMLFHHEFGSQKKDCNQDIVSRRTNNINHFREKWQAYLTRQMRKDAVAGTKLFSEETLCFAFAVTEAGENVSAGDYFTAMELATSLQKHGHRIKYLCRRGDADWYDVGEEVDVLISMLDAYDLGKAYNTKSGLVTVAWARNWFTRWAENKSIQQYTILFASSKTACDYMKSATGRTVELFPIATNAERFLNAMKQPEKQEEKEKYGCDYVFTGSYWNDPREIIDILDPKNVPYRFKVFGKNWESVPKLAEYSGGFLNYEEMPKVYKYSQIVLDDANRVTIEYGAVNSRVFDALAAGRLVLTNGEKGAEETFEGMLPVFKSKKGLRRRIMYYMAHPAERDALAKKLQDFVLANHTYDIRANTLLKLLAETVDAEISAADRKIAILAPVPKWSEVNAWGDYHFAVAMKKCFEKRGYRVEIRILPEWENDFDGKYVIVLRGLSVYHPKKQHVNLMWNISHPDDVPVEEYNQYDAVFISSLAWAEHIKKQVSVPVYPLLQCTDPDVFNAAAYGDEGKGKYDLLFVGNSRKVFRQIIKDLIPTPYRLSVFGTNWDKLIDKKYIEGESIPNDQLGKEYHSAAIVLNDHWEDMKQKGFISNRIFDGLSAGAFMISDEIEGIDDVLKNCIVTYHDRDDLANKVKYYMEHPEKRKEMADRGMALVREKHTFSSRVDTMIEHMEQLKRGTV